MACLLLPVGPGKDQQERALANCLDVVRYVAVERQQLSPGYFDGCIGEVEAYMTSERQDGKTGAGALPFGVHPEIFCQESWQRLFRFRLPARSWFFSMLAIRQPEPLR